VVLGGLEVGEVCWDGWGSRWEWRAGGGRTILTPKKFFKVFFFLIANSHFPQLFLEERLPNDRGVRFFFLINSAQGSTLNPEEVFGAPTPKLLGRKKIGGPDVPKIWESELQFLGVG
jgi:hypothetical protein